MFETPTIGKIDKKYWILQIIENLTSDFKGWFTVLCIIHFTLGDADIVLADAGTGQILNTVHVNQKVRKLLAVGKR